MRMREAFPSLPCSSCRSLPVNAYTLTAATAEAPHAMTCDTVIPPRMSMEIGDREEGVYGATNGNTTGESDWHGDGGD